MPDTTIITFPVADNAIAELRSKYMGLTVKGLEDKAGLAACHNARMEVKGLRVDVEKKRVELKADALEYGRKVDAEAKRLTGLLAPIETHLEEQEAIVTREKARIKAEEEAKKQAALQVRMDALDACFSFASAAVVAAMSDEDFAKFLENAQQARAKKLADDAEADRLRKAEDARLMAEREELQRQREAQEAEARKAREEQAAKLAAERSELAKQKAEQEAAALAIRKKEEAEHAARHAELAKQQAAQEAEAKRIHEEQEAERRKLDAERRAIELEKARAEAAEKSRIETEQRIAHEKAEAEERERRAKAEAELKAAAIEAARVRAEALRPDREKLLAVADAVALIVVPAVSDEAKVVAADIDNFLDDAAATIREMVAKLNVEVHEEELLEA